MDGYHVHCNRKLWICVLSLLIILDCYFHICVYYNVLRSHAQNRKFYDKYATTEIQNETIVYYKYPLIYSVEASMDYQNKFNSSYYWFTAMKHLFKDMGQAAKYKKETPMCHLNTTLEPKFMNKTSRLLEWIKQQKQDVKLGGYHAPAHCRAISRVAIIIPYRDRRLNLSILLRYLHSILKKQLLEYRIFVIEQYGKEKFNKGILYNIAFLETQRFGTWNCLIFHDVDLIPEDERISYSCAEHPTHMSPAVESPDNISIFGGITALTPKQYESVNGYSNLYWDSGAEGDDFYQRSLLFAMSKLRSQKDGLTTLKYNLINVTEEKLYTHILADVNPTKMKLNTKSLMQRLANLATAKSVVYGQQKFKLGSPHML